MKRILLLATGGTIATRKTEHGLVPQLTSQELLSCIPEIASVCQVETLQLFNLDSTNLCPHHWVAIAEAIRERYDLFDGFVISHGTDTMAYTAAALNYLIQDAAKPIVLRNGAPVKWSGTLIDGGKPKSFSVTTKLDFKDK